MFILIFTCVNLIKIKYQTNIKRWSERESERNGEK